MIFPKYDHTCYHSCAKYQPFCIALAGYQSRTKAVTTLSCVFTLSVCPHLSIQENLLSRLDLLSLDFSMLYWSRLNQSQRNVNSGVYLAINIAAIGLATIEETIILIPTFSYST